MAAKFQLLDLKPIGFSLTAGTDIPSPPESLMESPIDSPIIPRPPTPGCGPLNSHPTSPPYIPGAYPESPRDNYTAPSPPLRSTSTSPIIRAASSSASPPNINGYLSPTLTNSTTTTINGNSDGYSSRNIGNSTTITASRPPPAKRPSSMRKLFGLQRLRPSTSNTNNSDTSSIDTPAAPSPQSDSDCPDTPATSSVNPRPSLRRKKSGSWFNTGRRLSGFFGHVDEDEIVAQEAKSLSRHKSVDGLRRPENDSRVDSVNGSTHEAAYVSSPVRSEPSSSSPAPMLPELGGLGNGRFAAEDLFRNIG